MLDRLAERTGLVAPDFRRTLAGVAPPIATASQPAAPTPAPVIPIDRARKGRRVSAAWVAAAAAAGIVLATGAGMYLRRDAGTPTTPTATPAEARAELLGGGTRALAWTATADATAKGATGDVVWSDAKQRGYMRFVGLAANDPKAWQYQLWIFDRTRDEAFPVDGGVFDVSSTGEVIVPISAKLHVDQATLFAVTVERPGGVVVSKRERIVVTAKPS
jgi:anti-sigma-K factor RskA